MRFRLVEELQDEQLPKENATSNEQSEKEVVEPNKEEKQPPEPVVKKKDPKQDIVDMKKNTKAVFIET